MAKRNVKYKDRYQPPGTLTKLATAIRLGLSPSTVEQMIRDSRLVSVMPERKRFVTIASIEAYEARRREVVQAAIAKTKAAQAAEVRYDD